MEWFQGEILLRAGGCLLQECGDRESKLQASAAFWNHCPHRLGSLGSSERLRFRFHFSFRASPVCSDQQPQISGKCSKSSRPPTANCDALLLSSWTQRIVKLCWISKSLKLNALTAVLKSCRWWERLTAPGRSESLPNQRNHKAQPTGPPSWIDFSQVNPLQKAGQLTSIPGASMSRAGWTSMFSVFWIRDATGHCKRVTIITEGGDAKSSVIFSSTSACSMAIVKGQRFWQSFKVSSHLWKFRTRNHEIMDWNSNHILKPIQR